MILPTKTLMQTHAQFSSSINSYIPCRSMGESPTYNALYTQF